MTRIRASLMGVLATFAIAAWVGAQGWPGDPINGQKVYTQHCLRCHGVAGEGNGPDGQVLVVSPANFQAPRSRLKTDLELLVAISHGVAFSPMHGWKGRLTNDEMWDVISYIRTMAPYNPYP